MKRCKKQANKRFSGRINKSVKKCKRNRMEATKIKLDRKEKAAAAEKPKRGPEHEEDDPLDRDGLTWILRSCGFGNGSAYTQRSGAGRWV